MLKIKLVTAEVTTIACPVQIEGTDENGDYVYIRYRNGWLRAGYSKTEERFWSLSNENCYNIVEEQVGDRYDGHISIDLWNALDKYFEFPESIDKSKY